MPILKVKRPLPTWKVGEKLKKDYIGECVGVNIATWSHRVVELFYKYHFDIHNLIKRGTAVDINDLK